MNTIEKHVQGARDAYGVTVTIVEQATRERRTIVQSRGQAIPAFRSVVEEIDELEGDWRVSVVSTPTTILADLRNDRPASRRGESPERRFCAAIGRLDLLENAA